jgi:hypothetical protein
MCIKGMFDFNKQKNSGHLYREFIASFCVQLVVHKYKCAKMFSAGDEIKYLNLAGTTMVRKKR